MESNLRRKDFVLIVMLNLVGGYRSLWEHALAAKISNAAFHICLLTKSHAMKATVCKAYVLILGWGMFVLENCWKGSAMEVASAALLPLGSKRYCETKKICEK